MAWGTILYHWTNLRDTIEMSVVDGMICMEKHICWANLQAMRVLSIQERDLKTHGFPEVLHCFPQTISRNWIISQNPQASCLRGRKERKWSCSLGLEKWMA